MNILRGTIIASNQKTYEVDVSLDDTFETIVARPLSPSFVDFTGAGFYTNPKTAGSKCLVLRDGYSYWILGYFNERGTLNTSGFIEDDNLPRTKLGGGDTLLRHPSGSSIHLTKDELRLNIGSGQKVYFSGGQDNTFNLYSHRNYIDNSAGRLSWYLANNEIGRDTPSIFNWRIKKNFEQFKDIKPSDYVEIKAGSIPDGTFYKDRLLEIKTVQYEGPSEKYKSYLGLSKDSEGNHFTLSFEDMLLGRSTLYKIVDGYTHSWEISDSFRTLKIDWMGAENYFNISTEDGNYENIVDNLGNILINTKGYWYLSSKDIKLGSGNANEPLVLGNVLKSLLEELGDIIINSKHLHSQGPTTGLFPKDIQSINSWKSKLSSSLSNIATTERG
jgi:hypothetical protein